ncbi:hypothetical protein [Thermocatellispora tengchongensis]|uniref:hypothetical protein n=1 Tax=Thermocatellispora tengchongensis TaxID=1073253 RepID=UPI0036318C72
MRRVLIYAHYAFRCVGGRTSVLRVIAALAVGAVLAVGASVAVVNVAAPTPEPPNQPLYNYGGR